MKHSEVWKRALKTFCQAFVAALVANAANITNLATAKVAILAALSLAASAAWNYLWPIIKANWGIK